MAGISGNQFTLAVGRQSGKGSPATAPAYKLKLTGGDMAPRRETIQLAETDASRQQGETVVVGARVEGTPEHYLRPQDAGLLLYGLLGDIATAGSAPNFTHTIDANASGSTPYFSLWKTIGAPDLVDKYLDCRITSVRIRGGAGAAMTIAVEWAGLDFLLGESEPVLAVVTETPYVWPEATVTYGGSAPGTVEAFELTVSNGGQTLQGDGSLTPYDYSNGELQVSGTMTLLWENDDDYRSFHGGSPSATTPSTTILEKALSLLAQRNANVSIEAIMAGVAIREYPLPPDPGGAPIRVALAFASQPQADIADYIKFVVKNDVASYPAT